MEEKKYDITETKELLDFVFTLLTSADKALSDGKFDYNDIMVIIPAFMKLGPAINDINKIPKELLDLDKEEMEELKAFVHDKFDIANDKLEMMIKKAFEIVFTIVELLQNIKK